MMNNINKVLFLIFFLSLNLQAFALDKILILLSRKTNIYEQISMNFFKRISEKNSILEIQSLQLDNKNDDEISKKIKSINPSFIFALGKRATIIADKVNIAPYIFTMVFNIHNLQLRNPHIGIKIVLSPKTQISKLLKNIPNTKKIGTIYSSQSYNEIKELKKYCDEIGVDITGRKIDTLELFPNALNSLIKKSQIDTFWIPIDKNVINKDTFKFLIFRCNMAKINILTFNSNHIKQGASISIHVDYPKIGIQAADLLLLNSNTSSFKSKTVFPEYSAISMHEKNIYNNN